MFTAANGVAGEADVSSRCRTLFAASWLIGREMSWVRERFGFRAVLGRDGRERTPIYRIGTTGAADVNLEDCSGCGLSGWGWQDNGWGTNVLGPRLYFEAARTQTIRIQNREDGLLIDQVMLSPDTYLNTPPGSLQNDATIYPRTP